MILERFGIHHFLKLIGNKNRIKLFSIFLFFFLSTILELFSIAMIIPVLSDFGLTPEMMGFFNFFKIGWILELDLIYKSLILLGIVLFKNIYQIVVQYNLHKLGSNIESYITNSLLMNFIFMDFIEYSEKSSGELIKNCSSDCNRLNLFYFIPLMIILSDILLLILILVLIFSVFFKISIIIFPILGIIVFAYHILSGKNVIKWGLELNSNDKKRLDIINEVFFNIETIKLIFKHEFFLNKFNKANEIYLKSSYLQKTLQNVTKNFYEIIIFLGLVILVFVTDKERLIVTLGIFAVSVFKLLPSLNRITSNLNSLKFSLPILKSIKIDNIIPKPSKIGKVIFSKLELIDLNFGYQKENKLIFKKLNIQINKGEFVGIIGKSGVGKSTLIKLLLGYLKPDQGQIKINGRIDNVDRIKYSFVPQKINLINDSIKKNIAFGENSINQKSLEKAVKLSKLEETIRELPNGIETKVGELGSKFSGGQIQRIGIARALYTNPDIIIFDESTNSLDKNTEKDFFDTLKDINGSLTIIFITHNPENNRYFSKIIKL